MPVYVRSFAAAVGKKEGEGPMKDCFDYISEDSYFGEKSWERAESHLLRQCFMLACDKAKLPPSELDYILSGDLLNQCISSAFAMRDTAVSYFGTYGACSTMAETLSLGAMLIDGGFAGNVCAVTGSHFCTAERQYRFPLEYGGVGFDYRLAMGVPDSEIEKDELFNKYITAVDKMKKKVWVPN